MVELTSKEFFEKQRKAEEEVLNLLISGPKMNEEYFINTITIIVEGKLDHDLFSSIKKDGAPLWIESIFSLMNMHDIDEETEELVNNKSLVKKFTEEMNKLGFLTLGIQDMDLDGMRNLLDSKPLLNHKIKKNIVKTSEARDMETLLISRLHENNRDLDLFRDLRKNVELSKNIGLIRYAICSMTKSRNKMLKQKDISDLFPNYHRYKHSKKNGQTFEQACKSHRDRCASVSLILDALVKKGKIKSENKEEILLHLNRIKELISSNLEDFDSNWQFYIRGHDLEWFIRDSSNVGGAKRFRGKLTSIIRYDAIKGHSMFKSLDKWRENKDFPELFA